MPHLQTKLTPTPRQNLLLAALPEKDYKRLESCLELVPLPQGWTVYENGGQLGLVYFPTTSTISLLSVGAKGDPEKIALIGNDGVFGISMLLSAATLHAKPGDPDGSSGDPRGASCSFGAESARHASGGAGGH